MPRNANQQPESMNHFAQRIAALSPAKLALLERRLQGEPGRPTIQTIGVVPDDSNTTTEAEVRSSRAELARIEAELERHPAVYKAALVIHQDESDGQRSEAYVVPDRKRAQPIRRLLHLKSTGELSSRLPYELPNGLVVIHLNRSETDFVYREIFKERSYLRHGVRLPRGACVFDVGAHIGLFTLFASELSEGAKFYAFEPIPPIFDVLRLNTSLYDIDVKLFKVGLSNKSGEAPFHFYPYASVLSGCYADPTAERETVMASLQIQQQLEGGRTVLSDDEVDEFLQARLNTEQFVCPLKTLSQILRETGVEQIDLLKIDVEKSELDVFDGIDEDDWRKIMQVVVEVHDIGGRLNKITGRLTAHGYQLTVEQNELLKKTGLYNVYAVRPSTSIALGPSDDWFDQEKPMVWASAEKLVSELQHFLRDKLPDHLSPMSFVLVNDLPVTLDGKVDYGFLQSSRSRQSKSKVEFSAPRASLEGSVVSIDRSLVKSQGYLPGNGVHGESLRSLTGQETLWPHLDRISDDDVNSLFQYLAPEETAERTPGDPLPTITQRRKDYRVDAIARISRGNERDLLLNLEQLSDDEVESLLNTMFSDQEILETSRAITTDAAVGGNHDGHRNAPLSTVSESPVRSSLAASESTLQQTSPEIQRSFDLAYLAYVRAVQEIRMKAQRQAEEEHFNYTWSAHEAWVAGGDQSLSGEFYLNYVKAMERVRSETQRSIEMSFFNYLETLRDKWAQAESETLHPRSLIAISQSMAMGATFAINTLVRSLY